MKINKSQLVELLTQKTGMEKEEIEQQLKELIKRINDAASRGKALEIKNFGLFYFDDDKNLRFDPSEAFRTEVNFKYAGMEPVEVKPPRDTSSPIKEPVDEEELPDEEDIFGLDEDYPGTDLPEEPVPAFQTEDEPDTDPFEGLLESDDFEPVEEDDIKKAGTLPAKIDDKPKSDTDKPGKKKPKDPVMLVMTGVILFVIVVAGYFIIGDIMDSPPPQETASQELPAPAEQQQIIEPEPEPVPADVVEAEQPGEESAAVMEEEPAAETEVAVYGLTGNLIEAANDGFTIVVHSLRSIERAQSAAGNLRDDGYRAMVTERTVDGQTVYRVGIGQFPTLREAQQHALELPEPYNTQNFIQRIQQ